MSPNQYHQYMAIVMSQNMHFPGQIVRNDQLGMAQPRNSDPPWKPPVDSKLLLIAKMRRK